ncbi:hypothetical protein WV31_08260 [Magnetospirillum sp. ME-1]|nr:Mu transposase C-terminal domain-containing protein [Magnetospirillum sp. ME-1]ARJ65648.1 hypothetical protein WV31_08260 [Magnetospirillum sp. ME-1]
MTAIRLARGDTLFLQDHQYRVLERLADGAILLEAIATGEKRTTTDNQLAEALVEGELRIIPTVPSKASLEALQEDFHSHPDDLKEAARRRRRYLDGLLKMGIVKLSHGPTEEAIRRLAEQFNDPNPPSYLTICRWRRRAGEKADLRLLVDRTKAKGNRSDRLGSDVRAIIDELLAEQYMTPERRTVGEIHYHLRGRINRENRLRSDTDQMACPSVRTLYNLVKDLDLRDVTEARQGKRAAKLAFDAVQPQANATHPLAVVEMDHTHVDLFCVDDDTYLPLGRPYFTVCVDKFSRMVTGFYLGFEPPSVHSVMQALRNAMRPKSWLNEKFPEIENEWPCHGVPDMLSLDRGMEFLGTDLEDFCACMHIDIRHSPAKQPWYKGSVERFFKTLNKTFLQQQPGTTFSNILERDDYDPVKNAIIPFSTLQAIVHKWVVDVFSRNKHRGINDIPVNAWLRGCQASPVRQVSHISELDALLGRVDTRKLRRTGIEFEHLHYVSDEIVGWLQDPAFHEAAPDKMVKIKYDPSDLATIRVRDPRINRYVVMPVAKAETNYATHLTMWQHKTISTYVRKVLNSEIDLDALARAREDISAMVAEASLHLMDHLELGLVEIPVIGQRSVPEDPNEEGRHGQHQLQRLCLVREFIRNQREGRGRRGEHQHVHIAGLHPAGADPIRHLDIELVLVE